MMKESGAAPDELRQESETGGHKLKQGYIHIYDQSQASKMEAIGQLTAGIAHDFSNLLMIIACNLHIVRRQLHSPSSGPASDISERVEVIGSAVEKSADLIRHLMIFSRQPPAFNELVNIREQVKSVFALLRGSLGEAMEMELTLDDDIWPVAASKNQFEAALINLAINARDAMGGVGKLVLEVQNTLVPPADKALAEDITAGDYVIITMSDTGCGMTPDVMARIYEPFYTTKKAGEGTGLGLSIVCGFVKQAGGYITVTSAEGTGTVFNIYLPRACSSLTLAAGK